jgi:hypothetical protein
MIRKAKANRRLTAEAWIQPGFSAYDFASFRPEAPMSGSRKHAATIRMPETSGAQITQRRGIARADDIVLHSYHGESPRSFGTEASAYAGFEPGSGRLRCV